MWPGCNGSSATGADTYVTRRLISALLAAALLPLAAAPAVASAPDHRQPAPRAAAPVRILDTTSPFSPNGDGHQDRVAVRYRLQGQARVSIEVKRSGKTVFRTATKTTHPGARTFRWDGTRTHGKHVADGRYRVVVHATTHGTTRTDSTTVAVRTTPIRLDAGSFKLNSNTVYPYATVIDDVVVGNFNLPGENSDYPKAKQVIEASRAQVLDRAGRVISSEPVALASRTNATNYQGGCDPCGRFTWDGRDSAGVRQTPGAYRIRIVQGRDAAGNVRILSGTKTVQVSRAQLEMKTTVLDLVPAAARQTMEPENGCNGCPFYECRALDSTRFPGGLNFRCNGAFTHFTTSVPGRRTPYDRFTVTATGGPSTPGATASAKLGVGWYPSVDSPMTGDTTTTSPAVLMTPNSEIYPAGFPDAIIWSVDSLGTSYDIASFQVTTYTYVPAA